MSQELARVGLIQKLSHDYGIILPDLEDFTRPVVVAPEYQGYILPDISEQQYHTDLSAVARGDVVAALESPAHVVARRQRPYEPTTTNDALRIGQLVHLMLLEPQKFKTRLQVMPKFMGLTKDGRPSAQSGDSKRMKAEWLAALPHDAAVVEPDELAMLFGMARSLSRNATAMAIFEGAVFEQTVYYRDPVTGLKCRVRPDIINRQLGVLADLKTTRSADFEDFQRTAWNSRYDIQMAMYSEGVRCVTQELPPSRPIISLEKEPPYSCVVFPIDEAMFDRGMRDYRRGLDRIAECVQKNEWPGYSECMDLSLPKYALFNK